MGVPIDPFTMEETVCLACAYAEEGRFAHLIGINADKYLQMLDNPDMDAIVRGCEIINADGASIQIAAEQLGVNVPERVAGVDLMHELCAVAASQGYRIFLLGAKAEVVYETKYQLEELYPGIRIVGVHDGYFDENEFDAVSEEITVLDPDFVFVGITSPKKEIVIEYFRQIGMQGVYVGVGGTFDVVSGNIPRAPLWMQKVRLEWLFRMAQEPRRLLKRYVLGNVRFLLMVSDERRKRKGMPR